MRMLIYGIAAASMATAVIAQTPPADPMASAPATMPPSSTMIPADPAPPAPVTPAAAENTTPVLVKKHGKWWNGERQATEAEIAEFLSANPQ